MFLLFRIYDLPSNVTLKSKTPHSLQKIRHSSALPAQENEANGIRVLSDVSVSIAEMKSVRPHTFVPDKPQGQANLIFEKGGIDEGENDNTNIARDSRKRGFKVCATKS
ncbi:MAG: hypothetical protein Q8P68_05780 [Candidatus Peregrinibacteria bacterium]|nr:hypothetical protein [Candidatus Peregrinibacteria bacterium]MDZ4244982.1 hypothetical protein [Candidatus Gracilibacteria bacterium]